MNCATISEIKKRQTKLVRKNPTQLLEIEFIIEKSAAIPHKSPLLKEFYNCSYKKQGLMWDSYKEYRAEKDSYVVYCVVNTKIVGWLFTFSNDTKSQEIMLYVHPKYRKNKIGSRLFNIARKLFPEKSINYTPHNQTSIEFFWSVDPKNMQTNFKYD